MMTFSVRTPRSHCRNVFAVLDRQQNTRAIVEAVTVLFGPVVDALARGNLAFADEGLTDRLAEFRRPRLGRLQRGRDDALEDFKGIVGMAGELAAAVGPVFGFIGGVERETRLLSQRSVGLAFRIHHRA